MTPDELHLDRTRAGSFGSAAEQYDRYRSTYPGALIDSLTDLEPTAVIDVGCGTGKVAVALAERGLSVLGVEVDERMAEVARGHGIEVQVSAFEDWDAAGRTFDLVTCGDAWHWIDPARGVAKVAEVLTVGGAVARFWTTSILSETVVAAFDLVYRELAPEVAQVWRPAGNTPRFHTATDDLFPQSGVFSSAELRVYPWDRSMTTEEWVGLAATISDHRRLGPARLATLLQSLRTTIDRLGGTVHAQNETYALLNQRV